MVTQRQYDWVERCTAANTPDYSVRTKEREDGIVLVEIVEDRPNRRHAWGGGTRTMTLLELDTDANVLRCENA